jgi:hypothetical protein
LVAICCAQHIFGWFAIAAIALRLDHESLDSTTMYVDAVAELKRCVLDRIGPPNRQASALAPRAALLVFLESLQPAQTMLRRQARSVAAAPTFDRGRHTSERNIGRQGDRRFARRWNVKAIVAEMRGFQGVRVSAPRQG